MEISGNSAATRVGEKAGEDLADNCRGEAEVIQAGAEAGVEDGATKRGGDSTVTVKTISWLLAHTRLGNARRG